MWASRDPEASFEAPSHHLDAWKLRRESLALWDRLGEAVVMPMRTIGFVAGSDFVRYRIFVRR